MYNLVAEQFILLVTHLFEAQTALSVFALQIHFSIHFCSVKKAKHSHYKPMGPRGF
jgi:hypothetical protein